MNCLNVFIPNGIKVLVGGDRHNYKQLTLLLFPVQLDKSTIAKCVALFFYLVQSMSLDQTTKKFIDLM